MVRGWSGSRGALAVANFDGFLLGRSLRFQKSAGSEFAAVSIRQIRCRIKIIPRFFLQSGTKVTLRNSVQLAAQLLRARFLEAVRSNRPKACAKNDSKRPPRSGPN